MRRVAMISVLVAGWLVTGDPAAAGAPIVSPLALARIGGGGRVELQLAQRAIEREWTVRGDSGALVISGGRSEPGAIALSATLPGAGQLYAGERRGLYFAAAELVGWLGWLVLRRDGRDLRDHARALAGSPEDSASAWSFERWEDATQEDAAYLRALYAADREAFDRAIATDPRYAPGWSTGEVREHVGDLHRRSDRRFSQSRATEGALWVNHLVAGLDALRAARTHNLPLRSGVELKARAGLGGGRPGFRVELERRF